MNNLTAKHDSFYHTPFELEARIDGSQPAQPSALWALNQCIDFTVALSQVMGREVDSNVVFANILGYAYNSDDNASNQSVAVLNDQLVAVMPVIYGMRKTLGI